MGCLFFFEVTKMLLLYYDVVGKCYETEYGKLFDNEVDSFFIYFKKKKLLRGILELLLRYISVAILNYMLPYGSSIPNTS